MFDVYSDLLEFEDSVKEIEEKPVETGKILFVGSSGFTRWSTKYGNRPLEEDIRMKNGDPAAINHGVGGSTTEQMLYYYPRLIKPYKPRALVFRCYLNDRAFGYSPEEMMILEERIFAYARTDFPGIKLYACSAPPVIRHKKDLVAIRHAMLFIEMLENYCKKHPDTKVIQYHKWNGWYEGEDNTIGDGSFDTFEKWKDAYSKLRGDIYIEDQMHFNQEGYDLCAKFFREQLDELL